MQSQEVVAIRRENLKFLWGAISSACASHIVYETELRLLSISPANEYVTIALSSRLESRNDAVSYGSYGS
jgi:hypothetical protein